MPEAVPVPAVLHEIEQGDPKARLKHAETVEKHHLPTKEEIDQAKKEEGKPAAKK
ncbi:hypothetical protein DFS34DRAFT_644133 [Phlyctochytrium arcticum]|nr:hypothetical protein DFS34DRAFT_644133 [Phlyctochytrium arcticum]